ncbi:MAG: hypothetical protein QF735_06665, partial [Phycisphaeraceae bacterium]|nr:hypothetical protein [Phycisphaeraceae bacterium]
MPTGNVVFQRADSFARARIETEAAMMAHVPDHRLVGHGQIELDIHTVIASPCPPFGRIDRIHTPERSRFALRWKLEQACLDAVPLKDRRFEAGMIRKDVRDLTVEDLEGFDAVVHLAALSNDPLGEVNTDWTYGINHLASVN